MMIKNFSIGTRLGIGLAVLIGISVFIGYVAANNIRVLSDLTQKMYNHPFTVSKTSLLIELRITKMHRAMKDIALLDDKTGLNRLLATVNQLERSIMADFRLIDDRFLGDRQRVDQAREMFIGWKPIRDEVIMHIKNGRKKQAADITRQKGAQYVLSLEKTMNDFVDFAQNKADQFLKDAIQKKNDVLVHMAWIIGGAIFVGGILALFRMVDHLLEEVKQIMMQPISVITDGLHRMVREIAHSQGKNVALSVSGADIEIDRRILDELKTPLIHLIRNAIDHGMETPAKRKIHNKKLPATLLIDVFQVEGGRVRLRIKDDGQGIDLDTIKTSCIKKGMSPEHLAAMTEAETLNLIFRSGLSTRALITEISGRGLGLAIVKESIEKLGGRIQVSSIRHQGTTFTLHLPISVATFRGILVDAGDHRFVLPAANVERIVRASKEAIKTIENRATLSVNQQIWAVADLAVTLDLTSQFSNKNPDVLHTFALIKTATAQVALRVDRLIQEQEVLVKPLGKQLKRVKHFAGATILGNGQIVLVLNVDDLLHTLNQQSQTTGLPIFSESQGIQEQAKSILVAEDSITSRILIKNILSSAGFQVKTAVDGKDALSQLKQETYDLLVTDVEMPRMNGFELTEKVRKDPHLKKLPVILLTGRESREDREKGIDAGANAYLLKSSFDQSNLLEVVKRILI